MARKAGGGADGRPLPRGLAGQVYRQPKQTSPLGRVLHSCPTPPRFTQQVWRPVQHVVLFGPVRQGCRCCGHTGVSAMASSPVLAASRARSAPAPASPRSVCRRDRVWPKLRTRPSNRSESMIMPSMTKRRRAHASGLRKHSTQAGGASSVIAAQAIRGLTSAGWIAV